MQPERETLTDSLASIIQILHLGYRSGTLTVERDAGKTIEEGYIIFVNGRIVDAKAQQLRSWAAFNYLKTWGTCRFSFISAGDTDANFTPALPANPTTAPLSPLAQPTTDAHNAFAQSAFPRRTQAGEAALARPDATNLQRTHRRLLLLINGQRGLEELARLMARTPEEVHMLMNYLEQSGFIRQ
jgi:hypothetical protein